MSRPPEGARGTSRSDRETAQAARDAAYRIVSNVSDSGTQGVPVHGPKSHPTDPRDFHDAAETFEPAGPEQTGTRLEKAGPKGNQGQQQPVRPDDQQARDQRQQQQQQPPQAPGGDASKPAARAADTVASAAEGVRDTGASGVQQAGKGAAGAARGVEEAAASGMETAGRAGREAAGTAEQGAQGAVRSAADTAKAGQEAAGKAGEGAAEGVAKGAEAAAKGSVGTAKKAGEMAGGAAESGADVAKGAAKAGGKAVTKGGEGAAKAVETGSGMATGAVKAGGEAVAKAGEGAAGAAAQGAKGAQGVARGGVEAAGKAGEMAADTAKAGAGAAAKGASGAAGVAGDTARAGAKVAGGAVGKGMEGAQGAAEAAGSAARGAAKGGAKAAQGAVGAVGSGLQAGRDVAGRAMQAAWEAPGAAVSGTRSTAGAVSGAARTTARGAGRAVQTGAWALGRGRDAAQTGVEGAVRVADTLVRMWYMVFVALPLKLMAESAELAWEVGGKGAEAMGRVAVWFLETATWAADKSHGWLLRAIVRLNRSMDGAISATPPLVKGQLARAAVVEAPEGPHLADSLSGKSPMQVGRIFNGLSAAASASKQEPLMSGGVGVQQGQQQPDIVEQVNAALHAAFDRPDVPLERMESAQPTEQQQQGQQAKEGQPQEGKQVQQLGGKDLRALDLQRDRLVEQSRLLVWHMWMVARLQLTAAGEVLAVTRGMWSWLLRCAWHMASALSLLVGLSWVAAAGAVVAATAWSLRWGVQQLRSVVALEVRARRVWAPLLLRMVDITIAMVGPALGMPRGGKPVAGAKLEEQKDEKEEKPKDEKELEKQQEQQKADGAKEQKEVKQEGKEQVAAAAEGKEKSAVGQAAAAAVQAPKQAAAKAMSSIETVQAHLRGALMQLRSTVERLVPRDPASEEEATLRSLDAHRGLASVSAASDSAVRTTWRLAAASLAVLSDATGNVVTDVARKYRIPLPKLSWFKGRATELAQDTAIASFARMAGHGPASVVAGLVGAKVPQQQQRQQQQQQGEKGGDEAAAAGGQEQQSAPETGGKVQEAECTKA